MKDTELFKELPEGFRLGTEEDIPLVTLTIAQAFADYEYPIPSTKITYASRLRFYYELSEGIVRNTLKYGFVLTNEDFSAVMLIVALDHMADYNQNQLAETLKATSTEEAAQNMLDIFSYIEDEEHNVKLDPRTVYIEQFAVQPPRQGQKLGSMLMRELFAQCEKENRDVFLYTNTEKNVSIYNHFGFDTVYSVKRDDLGSATYYLVHPCNAKK